MRNFVVWVTLAVLSSACSGEDLQRYLLGLQVDAESLPTDGRSAFYRAYDGLALAPAADGPWCATVRAQGAAKGGSEVCSDGTTAVADLRAIGECVDIDLDWNHDEMIDAATAVCADDLAPAALTGSVTERVDFVVPGHGVAVQGMPPPRVKVSPKVARHGDIVTIDWSGIWAGEAELRWRLWQRRDKGWLYWESEPAIVTGEAAGAITFVVQSEWPATNSRAGSAYAVLPMVNGVELGGTSLVVHGDAVTLPGPSGAGVVLDDGAATTTDAVVDATLVVADARWYRLHTDRSQLPSEPWQPLVAQVAVVLPAPGDNTVYVQYADQIGNLSPVVSDAIRWTMADDGGSGGGGGGGVGVARWLVVDGGGRHSCAIDASARLHCWGDNVHGQLGHGDTAERSVPAEVGGAPDMRAVAAGFNHTCAIAVDRTLWCWGDASHGALGLGSTDPLDSRTVPAQVGSNNDWAAISAGYHRTCAINTAGALFCWGHNGSGQLGDGTAIDRASPTRVGAASDWSFVSVGGGWLDPGIEAPGAVCGVRAGALYCWGENEDGQVGDGTTLDCQAPVRIAATEDWAGVRTFGAHTCALTTGGAVQCWGANERGQLGDGTSLGRTTPAPVSGLGVAAALGGGAGHSCALAAGGGLTCWGDDGRGQLGSTAAAGSSAGPVAVAGAWSTVASAGGPHACGIRVDGELACWGHNIFGQVGDSTHTDRHVPVRIGDDPAPGLIRPSILGLNAEGPRNELFWAPVPTAEDYAIYWTPFEGNGVAVSTSKSYAGSTTVTTFDHGGVADGTTYCYRVLATDANADTAISEESCVLAIAAPTIGVDVASLTFVAWDGEAAPPQALSIRNEGAGDLSAALTAPAAWFSIDPLTVDSSGEWVVVDVAASCDGLTTGVHATEMTITDGDADNSPVTVPVELTCRARPTIGLSATTMDFSAIVGAAASPQTLGIHNAGAESLSWSVTSSQSWLVPSPTSGTSTGETDDVTVTASCSGLAAGTYNATLTVSHPAATNNPRTVAVSLTCAPPPPSITVQPSSLAFSAWVGDAAANQTFQIRNSGGGTLSYTVGEASAWLGVSPGSGSSTGEWDTITVSASCSGLTAGSYNALITVADGGADNSPQTVAVSLACTQRPKFAIMYESHSFSADAGQTAGSKSQYVWNQGGGTLEWTATESLSWLSLSPTSGTSTGAQTTITVSASCASLSAGTYNGSYTLSDPDAENTPVVVNVTLVCNTPPEPPMIGVSPASSSLSANSGSDSGYVSLFLSNGGDGTLSYTISGPSWLSEIVPTSGSLTTQTHEIYLRASCAALSAGTYNGNLTISASGAGNTPFSHPVSLTCTDPDPTIALNKTSLSFSATAGSAAGSQTFTVSNSGGGTLSYSITKQFGWVTSISPTSGSSTGEADTITVYASCAGLSAGNYEQTLTISAAGATNSPRTVTVGLSCTATVPSAPSSLIATAENPFRIRLNWTDNSSNETGFKIERSPNGSSSWTQIATVGANTTQYLNTGLSESTAYYYRVRAYNGQGNSTYTSTANASTPSMTLMYFQDFEYSSLFNDTIIGNQQWNDGTDYWSSGNAGRIRWATTAPYVYAGSRALWFSALAACGTADCNQIIVYRSAASTETVRVRVYVYNPNASNVTIQFQRAGGTAVQRTVTPGSYQLITADLDSSLSTGSVMVHLGFIPNGQHLNIDNLRMDRFTK